MSQSIYGPKKNAAFNLYVPFTTAGARDYKGSPTIAAGDVQVSKDGGAFANAGTLPAETPASGKSVNLLLPPTEMNADVVVVRGIDQTSPKEWSDWEVTVYTRAVTASDIGVPGYVSSGPTSTGFVATGIGGDLSSEDNAYNGSILTFTSGVCVGQSRTVGSWAGEGQSFDFTEDPFTATASVNDTFVVFPARSASVAVWDVARSGHAASGSFGQGVASVQGNVTGDVVKKVLGGGASAFTADGVQVSVTVPSAADVADAVWDEPRSGHTTAGSFGEGASSVQGNVTGSVQGNVSGNVGGSVAAVSGNVGGNVLGSVGSLGAQAKVDAENAVWNAARSSHTTNNTFGQVVALVIRTATCPTNGTATTIVLDASASSADDAYKFNVVAIIAGAGAGQARTIKSYVGSTQTATVSPSWSTNPAGTSVFAILNLAGMAGLDWSNMTGQSTSQLLTNTSFSAFANSSGPVSSVAALGAAAKTDVANAVWDAVRASHVTSGTFGEGVKLAAAAIDTATVTAGYLASVAQQVLKEPLSGVEVAIRGVKSLGSALQRIRNKVTRRAPGSSLFDVYETDGTTVAYTETVTTDATQDPVVGSTPST